MGTTVHHPPKNPPTSPPPLEAVWAVNRAPGVGHVGGPGRRGYKCGLQTIHSNPLQAARDVEWVNLGVSLDDVEWPAVRRLEGVPMRVHLDIGEVTVVQRQGGEVQLRWGVVKSQDGGGRSWLWSAVNSPGRSGECQKVSRRTSKVIPDSCVEAEEHPERLIHPGR